MRPKRLKLPTPVPKNSNAVPVRSAISGTAWLLVFTRGVHLAQKTRVLIGYIKCFCEGDSRANAITIV